MTTDSGGGTRLRPGVVLWAVGAFVLLAVVTSAVVGAVREPDLLDRDTPEGVVQRYAQAVIDEDYEQARGFLAEDVAERCTATRFRETWVPESLSLSLDEVSIRGEEAEVRVHLRREREPPPFGSGGYETTETFVLAREGGEWRLTDIPWPLSFCDVPR